MGDKTGIQWTDATWNPIVGCAIVSPACTNCYAMAQAHRIQRMTPGSHYEGTTKEVNGKPVWTGVLKQAPEHILTVPLRWKRPRRIFVNSMSDLFHESVPDEWIDCVFAIMALAPQHTFQVLTKRPKRMRAYCSNLRAARRVAELVCDLAIDHEADVILIAPEVDPALAPPGRRVFLETWPLPNIWLGVTAEDQTRADERIPDLLATPAAVRFVSIEPMLGPIDLDNIELNGDATMQALTPRSEAEHWREEWAPEITGTTLEEAIEGFLDWGFSYPPSEQRPRGLDWVICGGESGPGARPMHPDWARSLGDQCGAAAVRFFFKQRGEWSWPEDPMLPSFDERNETTPELPFDWRECDRGVICMRSDGTRTDGYGGGDEEFLFRIGKKRAGRLLDGREYSEFPA